jgi:aryl sulfotransferase
MWHFSGAWNMRTRANIVLIHYADLVTDLQREMRQLADRLGITIPDHLWAALVEAATFDHMRARANRLVPDPLGFFLDKAAFFRKGKLGSGRELLTSDEYADYLGRTARMAPGDLLAWLHRDS